MTTKIEEIANQVVEEDYLIEFKETLSDLLNIEPGEHPELPERIHRALRLVYTVCEFGLQKIDGTIQALVEHAINQSITESTYHRLLVGRRIFTSDEFQKALINTTEQLGGGSGGTA